MVAIRDHLATAVASIHGLDVHVQAFVLWVDPLADPTGGEIRRLAATCMTRRGAEFTYRHVAALGYAADRLVAGTDHTGVLEEGLSWLANRTWFVPRRPQTLEADGIALLGVTAGVMATPSGDERSRLVRWLRAFLGTALERLHEGWDRKLMVAAQHLLASGTGAPSPDTSLSPDVAAALAGRLALPEEVRGVASRMAVAQALDPELGADRAALVRAALTQLLRPRAATLVSEPNGLTTMTQGNAAPPKVFVSYSHDSEDHRQRVLNLSDRLRAEDEVDCMIDRYVEPSPAEGWERWMRRQIREADFVLMVCTETYLRRVDGDELPDRGHGAIWESQLITTAIYRDQGRNSKFFPVVFSNDDVRFIPDFLSGTRYDVSDEKRYRALVGHLKGYKEVVAPALGSSRARAPVPPPGQLAHVATSGPAPAGPRASARAGTPALLVLLAAKEGHVFVPAIQVSDRGTEIVLSLTPTGADGAAFLQRLASPSDVRDLWVAFDHTATPVVPTAAARTLQHGEDVWTVTLTRGTIRQDVWTEIGTSGKGPGDVAELRARRILLDERAPGDVARWQAADPLLEALVQGLRSDRPLSVSPLRGLYAEWNGGRTEFLAAARLVAVLWLLRTATVETVLSLDLGWAAPDRLSVQFHGRRRKYYSNAPAEEIRFSGTCDLLLGDSP